MYLIKQLLASPLLTNTIWWLLRLWTRSSILPLACNLTWQTKYFLFTFYYKYQVLIVFQYRLLLITCQIQRIGWNATVLEPCTVREMGAVLESELSIESSAFFKFRYGTVLYLVLGCTGLNWGSLRPYGTVHSLLWSREWQVQVTLQMRGQVQETVVVRVRCCRHKRQKKSAKNLVKKSFNKNEG
jgi:hypothetical protein